MNEWLGLEGRTILVTGFKNKKSVAWHVGRKLRKVGAKVVWTVRAPERKAELDKLAPGDPVRICDAGRQESIDAAERGSDEARTLIEEIHVPPDILSAVLTLWALERDPEADTGDAPRPRNGATPEEKMMLIAMWFAGRREFLAGAGEAATAAQRKTRSRWAERVRADRDRIRDYLERRHQRPEEDR